MPKSIRKTTPKSILSEIQKLKSGVQQKEQMIDNCKRECSEKVKAWRHEIAVEQSQIRKLEREYDAALLDEAADAAKAEEDAAAHLRLSYKLRECIGVVYEGKASEHYTRAAAEAVLRDYPSISQYTYGNVSRLVESAEQNMQAAAAKHQEISAALKEKADLLETGEHIMGGGLVAELAAEETRRRQSDMVPNGYIRSGSIRR